MHYTGDMCAKLNEQRLNGLNCDITITVDGRKFTAHRCILTAACPYFQSMLEFTAANKSGGGKRANKSKSKDAVVDIECCSADVFSAVLDHIYQAQQPDITAKNVTELLVTSDHFLLGELKSACEAFLRQPAVLTNQNVALIWRVVQKLASVKTVESVLCYILTHAEQLFKEKFLIELDHDELRPIVAAEQMLLKNEDSLLRFLLDWHAVDAVRRREALVELLQCVRFSELSENSLQDVQKLNELYPQQTMEERQRWENAVRDAASKRCRRSLHPRTRAGPSKECVLFVGDDRHDVTHMCAYIVDENRWVALTPPNFRLTERSVAVVDGDVYVTGGCHMNIVSDLVHKYAPALDQWTVCSRMLFNRHSHESLAFNHALYVLGGFDQERGNVRDVEFYDTALDEWQSAAPLPQVLLSTSASQLSSFATRQYIYCCKLEHDSIPIVYFTYRYSPQYDTWTEFQPEIPRTVVATCSYLIADGMFELIGTYLSHIIHTPPDGPAGDGAAVNDVVGSSKDIYNALVHPLINPPPLQNAEYKWPMLTSNRTVLLYATFDHQKPAEMWRYSDGAWQMVTTTDELSVVTDRLVCTAVPTKYLMQSSVSNENMIASHQVPITPNNEQRTQYYT